MGLENYRVENMLVPFIPKDINHSLSPTYGRESHLTERTHSAFEKLSLFPLAVGRGGPSSPASAWAIHQVQWGNLSFKALQEQVVTVSPVPGDCHPVTSEMQQD